jgi:hypothetical protein
MDIGDLSDPSCMVATFLKGRGSEVRSTTFDSIS